MRFFVSNTAVEDPSTVPSALREVPFPPQQNDIVRRHFKFERSNGQYQTIAMLIYKVGWRDYNLGYAAAMSWALFLIILIVAAFNALLTKRLGGGR